MHTILTRCAAAAAGVLLPVIVAVFALACTAPHANAPSGTGSQQTTAVGLSDGHHHSCRHHGTRSWSRSVNASACTPSAQFSFWFSGSQNTGRARSQYGDPGASQPATPGARPAGTQPGSPQPGSNPGISPAGTQPGSPPSGSNPGDPGTPSAGTQPTGTQPVTPAAGT